VARIAPRIGLTTQTKPEKIEQDLMRLVPQEAWTSFGPAMVLHGRYTCTSSAPACGDCVLEPICEKNLGGVAPAAASGKAKKVASKAAPAKTTTKKPAKTPGKKAVTKAKAALPEPASSFDNGSEGGDLFDRIPESWRAILADELQKPYIANLEAFVAEERTQHTIFPPEAEVFSALELTPYDDVNVLLLGQDPYHDVNQAHGLCFSVKPGIKPPPSLVNMYKELRDDVGFEIPNHGYLVDWARQGMLMINAVLTVRAHKPNSHKGKGWEKFTDAIIRKVNEKPSPVVFVLWGGYAQKKAKLIDTNRHTIIKAPHPSPLSASAGFFGSRCFSAINTALRQMSRPEIDWQLEDL
jgi:uracil-DNA glycosylase